MRIIAKKILIEFWTKHPQSEGPLKSRYFSTSKAQRDTPHQLLQDFSTADILQDTWVVFNIGGNKYRLIAKVNYSIGIVFVRFIGTHAEYDSIKDITTL